MNASSERVRQEVVAPAPVIAGRIVAAADSQPLAGATVRIVGTAITALTSADGRFAIAGLPPGAYAIEAVRVGFEPARIAEARVTGDTTRVSLAMKANALQLQSVVTTGAADPLGGLRAPFTVGGVPEGYPANQCFTLTLAARGDPRAFPPSGTIRLHPAPFPSVTSSLIDQGQQLARRDASAGGAAGAAGAAGAGGGGGGGGRGGGRGGRGAGAPVPTPILTALPVSWGRLPPDSILVRWPVGEEEIVLRLQVTETGVAGTAISSGEGGIRRTAAVSGRMVLCGGE